jgi:mono/diheme cytochrome c family protein
MKPGHRVILTVIVTIIVVIAAEICVALALMGSGVINVGADHSHGQPTKWFLEEAMDRSVREHAKGLQAPAPASMARGAFEYGHMCVGCHGAPGVERSAVGNGLNPFPPDLIETADEWTVEQVFWIVKHGVGDTGMPAFGPTHEDPELWAIAYFVKQLPKLTPADYQRLVAEGTQREQSGESSGGPAK